jgi:hypothetical protein
VQGSRSAYNDAIIATSNQQVLSMIVRMRYGEPTGLLSVSSITANMRTLVRAGAQFGIGSDSSFAGNLVPLDTGFVYEENPTISYVPVQGETYMRYLLSPLPLDLTVLLLGAIGGSPEAATLLLRSINGIPNPDFLADSSVTEDPRFARLAGLLAELVRQGRVSWVQDDDPATPSVLAFKGQGVEAVDAQIEELYGLLGFEAPRDSEAVTTLPLGIGIGRPDDPSLLLETRSLFALFSVAAASVEVPDEHLAAGIAHPLPPVGAAGGGLRIRRAERRPDDPVVAIRHHGWWFFIDASDAASKLAFRMLESLLSVRIADASDKNEGTPVLTVPVSR